MQTTERLHALDAVRGFALIAGVVLHATMSFLPGLGAQGWPINIAALIGVTVLFAGLTVRRLTRGMS